MVSEKFDLNYPLIEFGAGPDRDILTVGNVVEGVQIFGGIGSGKTSGSGRTLALKYLAAGFGGLVLTVKPDEKQSWEEYCRLAGRSQDLIILEPGGKHRFNFLEYEANQEGGKQAMTENVVEVLKTVIRAGEEKSAGKSDDAFWETALDMLIFNTIDLCQLAYGTVSVQHLYDIVQTIPKSREELEAQVQNQKSTAFNKAFDAAKAKVGAIVGEWEQGLTAEQQEALIDDDAYMAAAVDAIPEARLLSFLDQFFISNFIDLSDKTRSIIDFTFSGFLFRLLREPIYSLFCNGQSTVKPEDSLQGKIILLALPVKLYHKVGRDCQILFKYIWQRAMEKRDVRQNARPLFLWADEAQNFLHEHDADYQATARSSRIATVYISQNIPNYYACMGGHKAEYRVKSFLGTLAIKIFHANADVETNRYASELIGDAFFEEESNTITVAKDFSRSRSHSYKLERVVRPEEFVRLRTGGELNNKKVDAIIHRQGNAFKNGMSYIKKPFNQEFKPA